MYGLFMYLVLYLVMLFGCSFYIYVCRSPVRSSGLYFFGYVFSSLFSLYSYVCRVCVISVLI